MRLGLTTFVLAAFLCTDEVARAQVHVAYAPGVAFGYESGLRQQLEAGIGLNLSRRVGSRDGMWSRGSGLLVGAAALTGFDGSPTYGFVEIGHGLDTTLAGLAIVGGPALRFGDETGGGVTARVSADLLFVQVGLRLVGIVIGRERDGQVCLTLGLGRF